MDFVLWACHAMHAVSIIVWFGGLILINAVLLPVFNHDSQHRSRSLLASLKRFQGFIWSSFWTAFITGFLLMILSPRFLWFNLSTLWLVLLTVKEASFALMGFFTWQMSRVVSSLENTVEDSGDLFEQWRLTYIRLVRRVIFLAIVSLLCAAGMTVV